MRCFLDTNHLIMIDFIDEDDEIAHSLTLSPELSARVREDASTSGKTIEQVVLAINEQAIAAVPELAAFAVEVRDTSYLE